MSLQTQSPLPLLCVPRVNLFCQEKVLKHLLTNVLLLSFVVLIPSSDCKRIKEHSKINNWFLGIYEHRIMVKSNLHLKTPSADFLLISILSSEAFSSTSRTSAVLPKAAALPQVTQVIQIQKVLDVNHLNSHSTRFPPWWILQHNLRHGKHTAEWETRKRQRKRQKFQKMCEVVGSHQMESQHDDHAPLAVVTISDNSNFTQKWGNRKNVSSLN